MDQAPLSSHKKRIARHFSVEDKERILNIFKACDRENPERPKTENVEVTAKAAGVSVTSVFKILREYKKTQGLHPPKVYRRQRAILDNINDGTKSALRRLIHSFFERNEPPTLDKVLAAVREDERLPQFKRTTLWTLIKEVGFRLQPSQSTSASTANPFVELEESPYSPQQSTCTNASSTAYPFKSKEPSCSLQPSTSTTSSPTTDPLIMLEEVSCSQMQEPGIDTTLKFLLEPSEQSVVNVATKLKSTSKRHKDKIYCRLCLKTSNKNSLTPLSVVDFNYPGKSDAFKKKKAEKVEEIHKMIKFCLPFFDSLTFNPIICSICLSRLKSSYDFANECLKNQRLIKKYADIYGTTERVININEMIESKFSLAGNKSDSDTDTTLSIPKVTRSSTRVPQQTRGEEHLEHLHEDGPATKKQKIYIESREENSMTSSNEDTLNIKTEPYEDDGSASKEFLTQDIPIRDIDQDNMDNITDESMIKVEPDCIDIIDSTDFIKTEPVDDLHIENEEFNKRTGIGTDIQEQHFYFRKTKNVASDAETNIPSFTSEPVFLNVDSRLEATTSDVNYVVFKMTDK